VNWTHSLARSLVYSRTSPTTTPPLTPSLSHSPSPFHHKHLRKLA
jgi:hypothetical protein